MSAKNDNSNAKVNLREDSSLQDIRNQIDAIDCELVKQLDQRAKLVFAVGDLKRKSGSEIHDPKRESAILTKISAHPHEHLSDAELQSMYKKIVEHYRITESAHLTMSKSQLPSKCQIGFVGFGLIAASVGLGLRDKYPNWKFLIYDPHIKTSEFVDWNKSVGHSAFELVGESQITNLDYVFLGAPTHVNREKGPQLSKINKCVLNLSSVQPSLEAVYGFHPLAGKETAKFPASQADLFYDKVICLTNIEKLPPQNIEALKMLAYALGAHTYIASPKEHDETLAYTSHLTHLLSMAFGLCLKGQKVDERVQLLPPAAREFLRLSGANLDMWRPIFKENKNAIIKAIEDFEIKLKEVKSHVSQDSQIAELFLKSNEVYNALYVKRKAA